MNGDSRGSAAWRRFVVPDALINPPQRARAALPDVLGVLESSGYGLLHLPPPGKHSRLLAVIADQVAEYAHHGYAVVAIGIRGEPAAGLHWRRLAPLLRHRGVELPPRHVVPRRMPTRRWEGQQRPRRVAGRLRSAARGSTPMARVMYGGPMQPNRVVEGAMQSRRARRLKGQSGFRPGSSLHGVARRSARHDVAAADSQRRNSYKLPAFVRSAAVVRVRA